MTQEFKQTSLLLVGPSWVGDMVMAQGYMKACRIRQPKMAIDVLGPEWVIPMVQRMPEVRNGMPLPIGHGELGLKKRWQLAQELRDKQYDEAVILPRSAKSALIPWMAGIPKRVGMKGEWRYGLINDIRHVDRQAINSTFDQFLALQNPVETADMHRSNLYHPRLMVDELNRKRTLTRLRLTIDQPVVILAPGAEYGSAKRWPASYFGELAKLLHQEGYVVWVIGSPKERTLGGQVCIFSDGTAINLCGATSLQDCIDLISLACVVVTNDSGLMHIAAAVDRSIVAIFGSSSEFKTPPLSNKATILSKNMSCRPCHARRCPLGHHQCMRAIKAGDVLEACRPFLLTQIRSSLT